MGHTFIFILGFYHSACSRPDKTAQRKRIIDMLSRTFKGYLWIAAGMLVFFGVGKFGSDYADERQQWPIYPAEVTATNIRWAQHMADEYALTVTLNVLPPNAPAYQAILHQAGPKGALEKRAQSTFANGTRLEVQVNPAQPSDVKQNLEPLIGSWFIASILAFILITKGWRVISDEDPDNNDRQ